MLNYSGELKKLSEGVDPDQEKIFMKKKIGMRQINFFHRRHPINKV